jgi:hypothetical protein
MFKVGDDNKTIYLTQGDTLDTTVAPMVEVSDGVFEPYVPGPNDEIRFALASNYGEEPIIVQNIPTNTMRLRVESEDTKRIVARKKPYVYDIQLTKGDGTVITFIDQAAFYSTNEVY